MGARLFRFHRAVISPHQRGPALGVARAALSAASGVYGLSVRARNGLYRAGWLKTQRAGVPVVSVGNITAGGTGKTPFAAWLARLLVIHKMRPAILSRGYGRHRALGLDDENEMLRRLADSVPVVVEPDRLKGAERAVRQHGADVLILDDGFQHRRLARDLDVVLIDAVWPFGAGRLLPRGLLREPLKGLERADFLVLTRTELIGPEQIEEVKTRLNRLAHGVPVALCETTLQGLRPLGRPAEEALLPGALREGRWAAFCGIGNPEAFRLTLRRAGCDPATFSVFADHERYSRRQIKGVLARACASGCDCVVTTEKDAVKVEALTARDGPPAGPALYALQTELDMTEGSTAFMAAALEAAGRRA